MGTDFEFFAAATKIVCLENPQNSLKGYLQLLFDRFKPEIISIYVNNLMEDGFQERLSFPQGSHHLKKLIDNYIDIPVKRKNVEIAFVRFWFQESAKDNWENIEVDRFKAYTTPIDQCLTNIFVTDVLEAIKNPIEYKNIPENEYMNDLVEKCVISTGISRVAIRLSGISGLECKAVKGFNSINSSEFSFPKKNIPKPFKRALDSGVTEFELHAQNNPELKNVPVFSDVESYIVIPIQADKNIIGTLSFGTTVPHIFSKSEILALEATSSSIGTAIANYYNYQQREKELEEISYLATSISAVEIAQMVRHECYGLVVSAQTSLGVLVREKKVNESTFIMDNLDSIDEDLSNISVSVEKVKLATKPITRQLSKKHISEIWQDCVNIMQVRFKQRNITAHFEGSAPAMYLYEDWIRTAWLNLLMNSYDAFRDRKIPEGKISLRVDQKTDKKITLIYIDNAGGIEVNKLKNFSHTSSQNKKISAASIFNPGISSKHANDKIGGGGFGMFLVRKGIQLHNEGSINLIDYRQGVRFKIELPTRL